LISDQPSQRPSVANHKIALYYRSDKISKMEVEEVFVSALQEFVPKGIEKGAPVVMHSVKL